MMQEYKIGNTIVRIHGEVDKEKIEEATKIFMKKVYAQRAKNKKG